MNTKCGTQFPGKGDYYSTGNDLSNFAMMKTADGTAKAERLLREFVNEYINHRKPVIALVNGPAIGIAATLLGLSDLAIASDKVRYFEILKRKEGGGLRSRPLQIQFSYTHLGNVPYTVHHTRTVTRSVLFLHLPSFNGHFKGLKIVMNISEKRKRLTKCLG